MTTKKSSSFFNEEEAAEIEASLRLMAADVAYNTRSSYSADSNLHPDNLVEFVDKHMHYLRTHPNVDARHYLSNLRLITKVR